MTDLLYLYIDVAWRLRPLRRCTPCGQHPLEICNLNNSREDWFRIDLLSGFAAVITLKLPRAGTICE